MTAKMLEGGYLSVTEAQTAADFRSEVINFASSLGFDTVAATVIIERKLAPAELHFVDNTPIDYEQAFMDGDMRAADPVMQHLKRAAVPIIWDQNTYTSKGQGPLWEDQARFGYQTGVALALHLPEGRHFILGVDRNRPLPKNPRTVTRMVADLQLFAVYAQDAAFRIFLPPSSAAEKPLLTPREVEALNWTMEGKTAWEVGVIMNITERTAVLHLQNAMHKLDCVNKHQAVLKAIRLGLVS